MAPHLRYEIYLPLIFRVVAVDAETGGERVCKQTLDSKRVKKFVEQTTKKYGGVSESHLISLTPFRGWWSTEEPNELDGALEVRDPFRLGRPIHTPGNGAFDH
jgi:hypothetical protein